MNKELIEKFIESIEALVEQSNETDYIQDAGGVYLKSEYLNNLISETKELIQYGESGIALENMLENLNEVSIFIDKDIANLVQQAFGDHISLQLEKILNSVTKS